MGDYILVRARIEGCPDFPGILTYNKIDSKSGLVVLNVGPIGVLGRRPSQIQSDLLDAIAAKRADHKKPASLRIELLRSEHEYIAAQSEIAASLAFLASDGCLRQQDDEQRPKRTPVPRPLIWDWYPVASSPTRRYGQVSSSALLWWSGVLPPRLRDTV